MVRCGCGDFTDGNLMSVDVFMFQQLLDGGKSEQKDAPTSDRSTRLLRQLLFPDSDCQVVS